MTWRLEEKINSILLVLPLGNSSDGLILIADSLNLTRCIYVPATCKDLSLGLEVWDKPKASCLSLLRSSLDNICFKLRTLTHHLRRLHLFNVDLLRGVQSSSPLDFAEMQVCQQVHLYIMSLSLQPNDNLNMRAKGAFRPLCNNRCSLR